MCGILTPNTGDEKMDKAYSNMQKHVAMCKTFDEFFQHFNYIVKTDDKEVLNKWLLKVLFVNLKHKHDFDKLLENLDEVKRDELQNWLKTMLKKSGGNK